VSPEKTRQFLKVLGVTAPVAQPRSGWIVSQCPLGPWKHENGKSNPTAFGCKTEPGDAFTTCFSCGWHGSMSDLVTTMRYHQKMEPQVTVKWNEARELIEQAEASSELNLDSPDIEEVLFGKKQEPLHIFPEWWLDSFPRALEIDWAEEYLASREINLDVILQLDVRADTMQRRVCFPVRDFAGRLMGLHGRAVDEGVELRYRMYLQAKRNNPIIWLGENWVDRSKPIVVVEGPFDLASVKRVYSNVVSPLFVNPSEAKLKRMADALEWITLYDRGKGGDAGRQKVEKLLGKDHVTHHLQPPAGRKDPGVCSAEEIAQLLAPLVQLIAKKP
jgi:hypothetical protein